MAANQPTLPKPELRLALGMRGGVSLAVWIGGACAEIDELRRAHEDAEGFWARLVDASPYQRVTVDVMAGASAGGLNGVLFAAAIRHGFCMGELLPIWQKVADVASLRRQTTPWSSLFDGDLKFLDVINREIHELIRKKEHDTDGNARKERAAEEAIDRYVDLQLSATLIEPLESAATSPGDEDLRRTRSTARFHFRHDPKAVPTRADLEVPNLSRLAIAARATASFPMAFEPAAVRSRRPATFRLSPEPVEEIPAEQVDLGEDSLRRRRLVDCRGVFSESRGPVPEDPAVAFDDHDFVVADGGIVDNIPLSKALDAARAAPANCPTSRVLVYLHPTGPSGLAGKSAKKRPDETDAERALRRRSPVTVASGLVASRLQGESIEGDLERLEAHNRAVRLGRLLRKTLLAELSGPTRDAAGNPGPPLTPSELADRRRQSYLVQRAGADAEAIQRLLRDPLSELGEDPFPVASGLPAPDRRPRGWTADDLWRSPIAHWTTQQRLGLASALRDQFTVRLEEQELGMDLLVGGLGPLTRSTDLLLELAREGEKQEGSDETSRITATKPVLYKLASFLRELVRVRELGWVCLAARIDAEPDVGEWVLHALEQLRELTYGEPTEVEALVRELTDPTATTEGPKSRAYFHRCATDLQGLAEGRTLPGRKEQFAAAGGGLREALVTQLELVARALLERIDDPLQVPKPGDVSSGATEVSGTDVIRRVLSDGSAFPWEVRLASLEVLLVDEQLVGAPGHVEIQFTRMSAAAPIINASKFTMLHRWSRAIDGKFTDDDHLVPDVKLAGNELASFSAFLEERWRVNDWTWGRLDAVPTLVDLLLDSEQQAQPPREGALAKLRALGGLEPSPDPEAPLSEQDKKVLRRNLIERRQNELIAAAIEAAAKANPANPAIPTTDKWQAGLETLSSPGSPELVNAAGELGVVAAQVIGETLPPRVPRIGRPLQAVLRFAARRFAKPTGVLQEPVRSAVEPQDETNDQSEGFGFPWLALVSVLVGAGLAALAYGAAGQGVSLTIGLVVGLLIGLVPGAILLWLAVLPTQRTWSWYATAASVGLLLGAGLTAAVTAAVVAVLD